MKKMPRPLVRRKSKVRLNKYQPANLQQFSDLRGHNPWHCKVFEARTGIYNVKEFSLLEVARKLVRITHHVDIGPGIVVESDILGLCKLTSGLGFAGDFATAHLKNPHARPIAFLDDELEPVPMGSIFRTGRI